MALYKRKTLKKNSKGFTMVEILLVMGFIAVASISTYVLYDQVKDAYVADAEIKNLDALMERVDKSYDSVSSYSSISLDNVRNLRIPIDNKLDLATISSPTPSSVQYEYTNVSSNICTKFTKSLVYKGDNISAIVNGQALPAFAEIPAITALCNPALNTITIVKNNPNYTPNARLTATNTIVNTNNPNPIPVVTAPPGTGVWSSPVHASQIDKSEITSVKNTAQSGSIGAFSFLQRFGITGIGTGSTNNMSCANCNGSNATPGGNPPSTPGSITPKPVVIYPPNTGVTSDPELVENYSCHTYAYNQTTTNSAYVGHNIIRDILFLEQYNVYSYEAVSSRENWEQVGSTPRWVPPPPPPYPPPPALPPEGYYEYDPIYGWVTYYTHDWVATGNAYPSCNYQDGNCRPQDSNPPYTRQEYRGGGPTARRYQERVLRRETDTTFAFNIDPDPNQRASSIDTQNGQVTVLESNWVAAGIAPTPVVAWCTRDLYELVREAPYNPGYHELVVEKIRTGPGLPGNRGWAPSYQAAQFVQSWFAPNGSGYDTINNRLGITGGGSTNECKSNALCSKTMGAINTTGNFSSDGNITFTYRTVFTR